MKPRRHLRLLDDLTPEEVEARDTYLALKEEARLNVQHYLRVAAIAASSAATLFAVTIPIRSDGFIAQIAGHMAGLAA